MQLEGGDGTASGDETLELELQRTGRVRLPVPGDEPAAGALQELPARQVRGLLLTSPLPRHAIASAFIYLSSVAVIFRKKVQSLCSLWSMDARTSNLGSSVVLIHVLDVAAASTERSVGSCTRPLSSSSSRSPTRLGSALSSSRRIPTRLGSALGAGSSSSLRSVRSSSSSSRSPIRLDLECKGVRPRSPETPLARQRFVLSDGYK